MDPMTSNGIEEIKLQLVYSNGTLHLDVKQSNTIKLVVEALYKGEAPRSNEETVAEMVETAVRNIQADLSNDMMQEMTYLRDEIYANQEMHIRETVKAAVDRMVKEATTKIKGDLIAELSFYHWVQMDKMEMKMDEIKEQIDALNSKFSHAWISSCSVES